mmetsp:Transcript_5390/g.7521  ORF Transcript_5390/g.7521 Transcript_5390/m.7521 type:complete len:226 (+) Transcript_5390:102-779(+)
MTNVLFFRFFLMPRLQHLFGSATVVSKMTGNFFTFPPLFFVTFISRHPPGSQSPKLNSTRCPLRSPDRCICASVSGRSSHPRDSSMDFTFRGRVLGRASGSSSSSELHVSSRGVLETDSSPTSWSEACGSSRCLCSSFTSSSSISIMLQKLSSSSSSSEVLVSSLTSQPLCVGCSDSFGIFPLRRARFRTAFVCSPNTTGSMTGSRTGFDLECTSTRLSSSCFFG